MGVSLLLVLGLLQTPSAKTLSVSQPVRVAEIDTGKLKGEPTELAWSPDTSQLFLQTSERDRSMMTINPRYFMMSASNGQPKSVNQKPEWEGQYWTWKSSEYSPGPDKIAIDIKEEKRVADSTSSPTGGAMAKGGTVAGNGGTTMDDAVNAAQNKQQVHVMTLTLKGEQVGQFVDAQFLPGYTFSWSPASIAMIAYVNASGHLAIMDLQRNKQQVESTKDVLLPAWSDDGSKIAFLERAGRNKYELYVATVRQ
ncbi:MAG: TolB family protein [Vicinamibacterales bacterium]